jgi:hypothetical protein
MKLSRLGLGVAAAAGMLLFAQEDADFTTQMKACGDAAGALRKLEQKTGPEAVKRAERIGGTYEYMIGFWRQRNANDAVKWSEEGKAAAVQLAAAASKNDADAARTAYSALGSTCKSCHDAHRERVSEGKYKIK